MAAALIPGLRFERQARITPCPPGTVIDGDFAVLDGAARSEVLSPLREARPAPTGMAALAPERSPHTGLFSQRGGWRFWLGGLALVAASFWTAGGHAWILPAGSNAKVKEGARQADAAFSLALLSAETENRDGRQVLHVEAEAHNGQTRARALPNLSILVATGKGGVMRYQLAASPDGIGPHGRQRFSTRLPVPPDGVRSVSVAFAP